MRLAREEIVNASQLLEAYLIPGAPGYRRRTMPTVAEAIALVHDAGGVAVWAHPFWDVDAADEVVRDSSTASPRWASTASRPSTPPTTPSRPRLIAARCAERGLLTTGSADFHGPDHPIFTPSARSSSTGSSPIWARSVQEWPDMTQ